MPDEVFFRVILPRLCVKGLNAILAASMMRYLLTAKLNESKQRICSLQLSAAQVTQQIYVGVLFLPVSSCLPCKNQFSSKEPRSSYGLSCVCTAQADAGDQPHYKAMTYYVYCVHAANSLLEEG